MDLYFWCKLIGWSPITCLIVIMLIITLGVLLSTGLGLALVRLFMERWWDKDDSENN